MLTLIPVHSCEGDGLALREHLSQGYDCTDCHVAFKLFVVEVSLQFYGYVALDLYWLNWYNNEIVQKLYLGESCSYLCCSKLLVDRK